MNEFLKQNNLCKDLIIQGKLDLLDHQFKRNETIGISVLYVGVNIIINCYVLYYIAHLLVKIVRRLLK